MNLTFNVCWIEDQASDAEVDDIMSAIRKNGFHPQIDRIETDEQIKSFAEQQNHYHDFELILLDLRLGDGLRGNEIAKDVRRHFPSTPLLFYSGVDETELRRMMFEAGVEGVYCVHRDRLSERTHELVRDLSPALNRLNSMRGLAAQVVADCDQQLRQILLHFGRDDRKAAEICESIKAKVIAFSEGQKEKLGTFGSLEELIHGLPVPSGILFSEAKERARSENGTDEVRELLRSLKNYPNKVLFRRNTLAHALEERTEEGWIIHRKGGQPLTRDDFERYRAEFLAHHRDVYALRRLLIVQ
jgi:DNA-binding NarL/FixJ family response regulator